MLLTVDLSADVKLGFTHMKVIIVVFHYKVHAKPRIINSLAQKYCKNLTPNEMGHGHWAWTNQKSESANL